MSSRNTFSAGMSKLHSRFQEGTFEGNNFSGDKVVFWLLADFEQNLLNFSQGTWAELSELQSKCREEHFEYNCFPEQTKCFIVFGLWTTLFGFLAKFLDSVVKTAYYVCRWPICWKLTYAQPETVFRFFQLWANLLLGFSQNDFGEVEVAALYVYWGTFSGS